MTSTELARIAACLVLSLSGSSVGPVRVAHADVAADRDAARALLQKGNTLRAKGNLRGALASYVAARALVSTPITGLEVGRTHMLLGELVEAQAALVGVALLPTDGESTNAAEARAESARLASEIAPRIATLSITLVDAPRLATSTLSIDEAAVPIGALGVPRKINPGIHRIVVLITLGTDVVERRSTIDLAEGESKTISISLALPKKAPVTAPMTPSAGPRRLGDRSPLVYVGFTVGTVGLLVGTATGIAAIVKSNQLDCPDGHCPPSQHEAHANVDRLGAISTASFIGAGVGALIGIYGLTRGRTVAESESTTITPWVGLGMAGIGGAF